MLLKKQNWWVWLILWIVSGGGHAVFLSILLDNYDEEAWYAQKKNWILGLVCLLIPFGIMLFVFLIDMLIQAAAKLEVPGKEWYLSPFVWIACLIVPIFGWIAFVIAFLYLEIATLVALAHGKGEKYLENKEKDIENI